MKESISTVWIIGLVTTFIFIFAGYLAVTISYSKTFKVKDEVLTIIEKHKGITNNTGSEVDSKISNGKKVMANLGSLQIISAYMFGMGYNGTGKCPNSNDWYKVTKLGVSSNSKYIGPTYVKANENNDNAYYCFKRVNGNDKNFIYYEIKLFYKMDLPVLGDLFTFEVNGNTNRIYSFVSSAI